MTHLVLAQSAVLLLLLLLICSIICNNICKGFVALRLPLPKTKPSLSSRQQQHPLRLQSSTTNHEIYWLEPDNDSEEAQDIPLGELIAEGEAVVCISNVASREECNTLFQAGLDACERQRRDGPAARGRSRFSVSDPTAFSPDIVATCDDILTRVLDHLDDTIPSIYEVLFRPGKEWCEWQPLNAQLEEPSVPPRDDLEETCTNLRELYVMGELEWSEGEPAINIYEQKGYFGCHKDHLALTVLIPLTSPSSFTGGGTGFWAGNRETSENPSGQPPTLVLKPPPGSALIFGGDVTHSGMPVAEGYRSVFVCSFSTRTPVSPADRLHGMQAPPTTSANFKGTL